MQQKLALCVGLLMNVRAALKKIRVKEVGGVQMAVNEVSIIEGFLICM
jgi:hypothetical protein